MIASVAPPRLRVLAAALALLALAACGGGPGPTHNPYLDNPIHCNC